MPTNYPGSNDVFGVPSAPGTTPLSSPGDSTRNLVNLVNDIGDALEAVQQWAAKTTHEHSGNSGDLPKLVQANTHQNADTDSSATALHHTIGTAANQAASGSVVETIRTRYLDKTAAQSPSGKITFPSGLNAPVIPDFSGANHNHSSALQGGYASGLSLYIPRFEVTRDPSNTNVTVGSSTFPIDVIKKKFRDFLAGSTTGKKFTIPANMAVIGDVNIHFGTFKPASAALRDAKAILATSYINPGDSLRYVASQNTLICGFSAPEMGDTGDPNYSSMPGWREAYLYDADNSVEPVGTPMSFQVKLPFYIPPTNADRPDMRIGIRVFNEGNVDFVNVDLSVSAHFVTRVGLSN